MQVRTYLPGPRLAPFVQAFQFVETREETVRTLVPDTGFIVALRYRGFATLEEDSGATRMPDQALTGLRSRARRMRTSANGGLLVAKLREGAAAAFFRVPAHELFSESVPLSELVPRAAVDGAMEELLAAATDADRISSMERLLLSCLLPTAPDRRVHAALQVLLQHRETTVRIRALASRLSLSQDALEKRFRAVVPPPRSSSPRWSVCVEPSPASSPASRWARWRTGPATTTRRTSPASSARRWARRPRGSSAPRRTADRPAQLVIVVPPSTTRTWPVT